MTQEIRQSVCGARTRTLRACSAALLSTLAAACGGGLENDGNGTRDRLLCATTCQSSSSLAPSQIRASYAIVGEGSRVQAQAGFSSGSDIRFNVELDGGDSLRLSTAQGTQDFHIPAIAGVPAILIEAMRLLVAGATPYLSEVTPPSGEASMQFLFTRGATTYTSSVRLPAPYQILSPASGTTLSIGDRTLQIRLSSATAATLNLATFSCTDVNGNTATGSSTLDVVPGSQSSDGSGVSYALAVGAGIDTLTFSTTNPRGAVSRCDVTIKTTIDAQGQMDARFSSGSQIFAQQIRSVQVTMR